MTLYEIDAAMQECIDPETGEVDADRIEALAMERDKKIENIALWIINIKADIETAKAEIDRLTTLKRTAENKAESLKNLLQYTLNGEKFKTGRCSISYRKSTSVVIDNEDLLPIDFKKVSYTPDKKRIKAFFDDNDGIYNLPGAHLQENTSVIIK
jgi:hypothetical protein